MSSKKAMRWPLPTVVNPSDNVCFEVHIPNDRAYIGAFYGAMYLLSKPNAWQPDDSHTGRLAAAVMREVFYSLRINNCKNCPEPIGSGDCGEDCMGCCIRFNNGVLEVLECGVWTPVSGQPAGGIFAPTQPGTSPQPAPGGGCQTYHGAINAGDTYLLPTLVSTGDTINLTHLDGAWTDENPLGRWSCPDGQLYYAGACRGASILVGDSLLPTAPYESIIAIIGSTYYEVIGSTFTIPSGITNEQLGLLMNNAPTPLYAGQVTFDVEVCNNSVATWSHEFDFTLSPWGWTPQAIDGSAVGGVWTVGIGWTTSDVIQLDGNAFRRIVLQVAIPSARDITSMQIFYAVSKGSYINPTDYGLFTQSQNGGTHFYSNQENSVLADTAGSFDTVVSSNTAQTALVAYLASSSNIGAGYSGSAKITKIVVTGTGSDPF